MASYFRNTLCIYTHGCISHSSVRHYRLSFSDICWEKIHFDEEIKGKFLFTANVKELQQAATNKVNILKKCVKNVKEKCREFKDCFK
jgi:hypothetical protein